MSRPAGPWSGRAGFKRRWESSGLVKVPDVEDAQHRIVLQMRQMETQASDRNSTSDATDLKVAKMARQVSRGIAVKLARFLGVGELPK